MKPPANAAHYVVVSQAGKHGDQWVWKQPDGSIAGRYTQSLRGWITAGMPFAAESDPQLTGLRVSPRERRLQMGGRQQLRAMAVFSRCRSPAEAAKNRSHSGSTDMTKCGASNRSAGR